MATPAQIAANRRNARLSTGPRTARGKSFSSRNRLRHGLRSRRLILPDEDPTAFANLLFALRDLHLAIIIWKLERVSRAELQATGLPPEASVHQLALLAPYRAHLEREFAKSLTANPQLASNANSHPVSKGTLASRPSLIDTLAPRPLRCSVRICMVPFGSSTHRKQSRSS